MNISRNMFASNTKNSLLQERIVFASKGITDKGMITYLLAMIACLVAYSSHMMPAQWWIFGLVSVLGFFHFSNRQTKLWINTKEKAFVKKLFWTAFALRVLWVLISYWLYYEWTGTAFSIGAADELLYDSTAHYVADMLHEGNWHLYTNVVNYSGYIYSDAGYPIYLSVIYWIFLIVF